MKNGRSLVDIARELGRQLDTKRDMIVPTGLMHHETAGDGTTSIRVETPDGIKTFLAKKVGITLLPPAGQQTLPATPATTDANDASASTDAESSDEAKQALTPSATVNSQSL